MMNTLVPSPQEYNVFQYLNFRIFTIKKFIKKRKYIIITDSNFRVSPHSFYEYEEEYKNFYRISVTRRT